MERAVKAGKLRSIGLSNYYEPGDFDRMVKATSIKPALLQNETHPYHQSGTMKTQSRRWSYAGRFRRATSQSPEAPTKSTSSKTMQSEISRSPQARCQASRSSKRTEGIRLTKGEVAPSLQSLRLLLSHSDFLLHPDLLQPLLHIFRKRVSARIVD